MTKKDPFRWMPWDVIDWLMAPELAALSGDARAGYFDLLNWQWYRGGLPLDEYQLQKMSRLSPEIWEREKATILSFFVEGKDGKLRQHRCTREKRTAKKLMNNRRKQTEQARKQRQLLASKKDTALCNSSVTDNVTKSVTEIQDRTGQDRTLHNKKTERRPKAAHSLTPEILRNIWNEAASKSSLQKCEKLTQKRRNHAKARIREQPDEKVWRRVITSIRDCKWCNGEDNKGWRASFDYLIRPDTHIHAVEGKFRKERSNDFKYVPLKESAGDRQVRKMKEEFKEEPKKTDGGQSSDNASTGQIKTFPPSTLNGGGHQSTSHLGIDREEKPYEKTNSDLLSERADQQPAPDEHLTD